MPDITNSYVFTASDIIIINSKKADTSFTHIDWSGDDLKTLRKNIRDYYRIEQVGVCCYCRNTVSLKSANNSHVEHIAPKSIYLDFIFHPKNLCVICTDCNEIKHNQEVLNEVPDTVNDGSGRKRYPNSSLAFKIVHPHFDEYEDHILQLGKLYINKTKKGNFTIGACGLNRYLDVFGWKKELIDKAEISEMFNDFLKSSDPSYQLDSLKKIQEKLMKIAL